MNGMRIRADGKYFAIWCKGCRHIHGWLPLNIGARTDAWTWNTATQTLHPSVRHYTPAQPAADSEPGRPEVTNCHYNIEGSRILYHGDSSEHGLRGYHELDEEPPANYGGRESFGWGGEQGPG